MSDVIYILSIVCACCIAGARHFQDFALDREFTYAGVTWLPRQWPVLAYCGIHTLGAFVFYVWAFPFLEGQLLPNSWTVVLLDKGGVIARPFVATALYLALVRGSIFEYIQRGQHKFVGLVRPWSEWCRRLLRKALIRRLVQRENRIAEKAGAHLAKLFESPAERCQAVRLCLQRLLRQEHRSYISKEHIDGKLANFEMVLHPSPTDESYSLYTSLGIAFLASIVHSQGELVHLLDEARNHVPKKLHASPTG